MKLNSKKLNISNIADKIKNLNIRILENQKRKDEILSTLSNTHEIKCYTCGQIITDENKINEIEKFLTEINFINPRKLKKVFFKYFLFNYKCYSII